MTETHPWDTAPKDRPFLMCLGGEMIRTEWNNEKKMFELERPLSNDLLGLKLAWRELPK